MDRKTQEAHVRQLVLEYYANGHRGIETAIRYDVSRKTLYKWMKLWDGTWQSLQDRSRKPQSSSRAHTEEEVRLIKRLAKKHHWTDILLVYHEATEKHGYQRSCGGFKRIVRKLLNGKGTRSVKPVRTSRISVQSIRGRRYRST